MPCVIKITCITIMNSQRAVGSNKHAFSILSFNYIHSMCNHIGYCIKPLLYYKNIIQFITLQLKIVSALTVIIKNVSISFQWNAKPCRTEIDREYIKYSLSWLFRLRLKDALVMTYFAVNSGSTVSNLKSGRLIFREITYIGYCR